MPFQWAQLFTMALEFKPDVILELGRGLGNSTCAFTEAANRLPNCSVISLDVSKVWEEETLPKVQKLMPAAWFEPLQALQADILSFDFESVLKNANRVLIFWDAHGFDVAECILGKILPLIQDRPHLVMMHDLADARYIPKEIESAYKGYELWKGSNAEWIFMQLGNVVSGVAQAISVIDFTSRNDLTLHSSDHDLHTNLGSDETKMAEILELLGSEHFSLRGYWFWFSLNEKHGPYAFPKYEYDKDEAQRKNELEEKMKQVYEFEEMVSQKDVSTKMRIKLAAKILLNRYPKGFAKGIMWDIFTS
ncbi:MAG: hypothetical protein ABR577_11705, partial [Pyrinomonadaceae bacterium]